MALENLLLVLAEHFGKKIIDRLTKDQPAQGHVHAREDRVQEALSAHLRIVSNWSGQVQSYLMPSARSVQGETVPLTFAAVPRRFRSSQTIGPLLSEQDLLSKEHLLILGQPGAGKTTTLKRLCRALLCEEPITPLDSSQVPILVRLRTFNTTESSSIPLLRHIAQELGLQVQDVVAEVNTAPRGRPPKIEATKQEICEGQPALRAISQALNELQATLFLDGLDEVNALIRSAIEDDIRNLLEASDSFRVIVTCRSGEYRVPLGYLTVVEVCELSLSDIEGMAKSWLGPRADDFIRQALSPSLLELAQRPLFLAHMLNLYHIEGYLPEQPCEIYGTVTHLMIREWDRERGIVRRSRYANFGAEKKLRFLAALAYEFTYFNNIKVFSERELVNVYRKLRRRFQLPEDEAQLVAQEIESHTGLVVEAGPKQYEFSHLTLQEYLAAHYLVRSPFPEKKIATYITQSPATLAIATALSEEPAAWLAGVLMNRALIADGGSPKIAIFLQRLREENPVFVRSDALGLCVLGLAFLAADESLARERESVEVHLEHLLESDIARLSFVDIACRRYTLTLVDVSSDYFSASRIDGADGIDDLAFEIQIPDTGRISRKWLESNFLGRELLFAGINVTKRR